MQFVGNVVGVARSWQRVAPAETGAIIGAARSWSLIGPAGRHPRSARRFPVPFQNVVGEPLPVQLMCTVAVDEVDVPGKGGVVRAQPKRQWRYSWRSPCDQRRHKNHYRQDDALSNAPPAPRNFLLEAERTRPTENQTITIPTQQ